MSSEIVRFVADSLAAEFGGDIPIYAEEVKQGVKKPCFFISTESVKEVPYMGERFLCKNRLLITFYPANSSEKHSQCEQAASRLFNCLKFVETDDRPIMGSDMSCETKEGVLYFHVNYNMFMYRAKPQIPKMEILHQKRKESTP